MYEFLKYLSFLWRSKNEHAVHSPFVYKLITEGVKTRIPPELKQLLPKHYKYLIGQQLKIKVEDFGAGSRVFKSEERGVDQIAKVAGMSQKTQELMASVTAYFKPINMLELGTSLGKGTVAMHIGHPEGNITTVERCPNTLAEAVKGFKRFSFNNITPVNALFTDFLNEDDQTWDLVYLDGGHTKDFTLFTFKQLLPKLHNDSLLILDDIYWSAAMTEAWQQIKAHPEVTVTIDSFHWGWVFFRKEQPKQHFVLRL
ncbi:O-methyltransferase [Gilvibacter sp.]|uniref:O-methyltransferase n=1 Tax=Gilvibacter sp. TaxID=2729997 RepID=UPI0035BE3930